MVAFAAAVFSASVSLPFCCFFVCEEFVCCFFVCRFLGL